MENNPFFADLSTYSPKETIPFYENVFGWKYYETANYFTAYQGNKEVCGLYETPEKFKQMRMPHFWMTYIQVSDVEQTINKVKELNGIIELSYEIETLGKIALIRDPQGAGFTLYEGNKLKNTRTKDTENTLMWNELHVSDIKNVIPFYLGIFDWTIIENKAGTHAVLNQKKEHVADILEIKNQYKGKYEYWVSTFGVKSLKTTRELVLKNGGNLIFEEENRTLCADNSGEAFFYIKEV